jgi:hypothetical protein
MNTVVPSDPSQVPGGNGQGGALPLTPGQPPSNYVAAPMWPGFAPQLIALPMPSAAQPPSGTASTSSMHMHSPQHQQGVGNSAPPLMPGFVAAGGQSGAVAVMAPQMQQYQIGAPQGVMPNGPTQVPMVSTQPSQSSLGSSISSVSSLAMHGNPQFQSSASQPASVHDRTNVDMNKQDPRRSSLSFGRPAAHSGNVTRSASAVRLGTRPPGSSSRATEGHHDAAFASSQPPRLNISQQQLQGVNRYLADGQPQVPHPPRIVNLAHQHQH